MVVCALALAIFTQVGRAAGVGNMSEIPTLRAQELLLRSQPRNVRPAERLSLALGAAQAAFPGMAAGNRRDIELYSAAVSQVVATIQDGGFAGREVSGAGGKFRLLVDRKGKNLLDPADASSILLASSVRLRGLRARTTEAGVGVPYVFCYFQDSAFLKNQPGVSRAGISVPVTALLAFEKGEARLCFINRLNENSAEVEGKKWPLAADFSAAIAQTLSRTPNRPFDIPGLLFTRHFLPNAGLFQFQLYDPNRIPVILVHGLFSRPEAWTQVLNGLMADPKIRKRYQFWFFFYPSGLPIWQSSMLLRRDLDRFHSELEKNGRQPNLHRIILVGHSMGGLISSLTVREPGRSFWASLSDKSLEDLDISPEARSLVKDMVKFQPRKDIGRVVYVTTPHRGSPIPHNPVILQAIRFIQLPRTFSRRDREVLVDAMNEDLAGLFTLPANSIRFLKSGSPVLEAVETLPFAQDIPQHSIIGDRGKGDSPDSTDGIVPYWSAHLPNAISEKIVPTDHSAPQNPETTREIRRILLHDVSE
ncbi:alpha/beta hydrolase family protein [Terrimicrobium sacchariphilum]|uniref:Alpha/beta hydrolase family protein n=2 Tax=Terrimicrobium sacchariphilum TaxID=690879 RepID=A0A146GF86_TERSA|nr:alpha/beta hydrolase family protein [Terrimicrobium sacchariphilum]